MMIKLKVLFKTNGERSFIYTTDEKQEDGYLRIFFFRSKHNCEVNILKYQNFFLHAFQFLQQ